MEYKLEITDKLTGMIDSLDSIIAVLNLPTANFCEKRSERVLRIGQLQQSCVGCVTQGIKSPSRMSMDETKEIIDYFAEQYGTQFITINGRGDPFHPQLKEETLEKVCYASERWGMQSYVFTAGYNLDEATCRTLASTETNVIISLYGNQFIDADFFAGKKYQNAVWPMQNRQQIAENLRRLIRVYKESSDQPAKGVTRLGMNYVVSEQDLLNRGEKVSLLKDAANREGIFFICNTPFQKNEDETVQLELERMAEEYSNFYLRHSTAVNGQCQMGAGSAATVDFDGTLLRCPYMDNREGNGRFQELSESERREVIGVYMRDRSYPCVMRKHQK